MSDVLADFRHSGIQGAHSGSLHLYRGGTKECVKGSLFGVLVWVTLASSTLGFFGGFGHRVFFHIAGILGLLFLVCFSFAMRPLSSGVFVASFLIHLDVRINFSIFFSFYSLMQKERMICMHPCSFSFYMHLSFNFIGGLRNFSYLYFRMLPFLVPHPPLSSIAFFGQ
jgi:hypothetical protein